MKKFLKRRRLDEMERHILLKSQRNAYFFLIAALLVWTFYESWRVYAYETRLNIMPCMLLAAAVVIQAVSQLSMTRNAVRDDEDSFETAPLFRLVLLVLVLAGIIATAGAFFLFMGVRR